MTDEQIIDRVRSGETRMFEELLRRHQDAVYAMAVRFIGKSGDAEDVAQDIFLRAFRGLDSFKGDAKFSTWLYRISYNCCLDWLRKTGGPNRAAASLEETGEPADARVDLAADAELSEDRRRVAQALGQLDEKYRIVVILLYYQGLSYEQIADVLGVPVKTVETRLYRARKLLRDALGEGGRGA